MIQESPAPDPWVRLLVWIAVLLALLVACLAVDLVTHGPTNLLQTFLGLAPTPAPVAVPTPVPPVRSNLGGGAITCTQRTCGSFGSCGAVRSFLAACPQYWGDLDGNGDGEPCESLCN